MYSDLALYIDGKWLNGEGRKGEDVINPATGKTLAHLPHASTADLDAALEAAAKGFAVWKATSAYDRAKIMRKAADLVRERYDHISKVQTQEQGKVYVESRAEVLTSADIIDWYAEEGRRTYGRVIPGRQKGVRQMVLQEPVGVVAAFTPWNFPTLTPIRKIAGALAAGCSLIIKASEGIALRGIQGANTTGFYIDDVPVLETLDPHIVDIARIEVLRGPQGTFYGAESMGGTVRIITEQPNATATTGQLHVDGSGTEHGSLNQLVEGVVNMPLVSDTVAVRASAFYQNDDGYFEKELGPESAPPTSSTITSVARSTTAARSHCCSSR